MKTRLHILKKTVSRILVIQTNNSSNTWLKKKSEGLPSSGLSRFTAEILLKQQRTYGKEQLRFGTAVKILHFSFWCNIFIGPLTTPQIAWAELLPIGFSINWKSTQILGTVSKTLYFAPGKQDTTSAQKWDHFVKGASRNNIRNECIRKHSHPHNFLQQAAVAQITGFTWSKHVIPIVFGPCLLKK